MTKDEAIVEIKKRTILSKEVGAWTKLWPATNGNGFVGLCPFHKEKTASFNVKDTQNYENGGGYYKCFGCGASGDAITFIKEIEKISATAAIRKLAYRLNIEFDPE